MKQFINSFRPSHPFFETLEEGTRHRINIFCKRNIWFDWNSKYKRLVFSFGKP
jgi:hypothetical protein